MDRQPPPLVRGRRPKIRYATQVAVAPPTFVLFATDPAAVHFSYRRYLENRLRDAYEFAGTPIRLVFREQVREQRPRSAVQGRRAPPALARPTEGRAVTSDAERLATLERDPRRVQRARPGRDPRGLHRRRGVRRPARARGRRDAIRGPGGDPRRVRAAVRGHPRHPLRGRPARRRAASAALSEWTIRGTTADGTPIEVRGCDLWEFEGSLIRRKDSYWKRVDP